MKNKAEIAAVFYAVLSGLKEAKTSPLGGIPSGHIYVQLIDRFNTDQWNRVVAVMRDANLITESNFLLRITPKGEVMHNQLDLIYKEAAAKV